MATKESRRQVRELIEGLEHRVHRGPPVRTTEIQSLKSYLRQNEFSPASDYFNRLLHLESRLQGRSTETFVAAGKRNYGGEAAGYQMQVQSVFDHVILSTCYQGEFNGKRGRVKLSHRFNQAGRIHFVELKQLRSLHPPLNGELRKLLLVNGYQSIRKDWLQAPAAVLRILPQELIFLYAEIFRCERTELFAWLVNIGHGLIGDLLLDLKATPLRSMQGERPQAGALATAGPSHLTSALENEPPPVFPAADAWQANPESRAGNGGNIENQSPPPGNHDSGQLDLRALTGDRVGLSILEKASALESLVEPVSPTEVLVRYVRRSLG